MGGVSLSGILEIDQQKLAPLYATINSTLGCMPSNHLSYKSVLDHPRHVAELGEASKVSFNCCLHYTWF